MSSQTVFRLTSQEGIDKIQAFKEPIPSAGRNEVLVKIRSVSLNYRDIAIANNTYPLKVKDGVVLGSDMAGEIVQIGSQVSGFSVGDHVTTPVTPGYLYGTVSSEDHFTSFGGGQDGMLQEHIILPVQALVKLPKSTLSFTQWAATNSTGVTVWNAFYGCNPLKPGDTVLVLGTGGVSLTALIIAKATGATVIVTSSSDDKLKRVKSEYGADHTINYKTHPKWADEVMKLTEGHGADHVIENGGTGTIEQSLGAVARGGTVSVIGFLASVPKEQIPDVTTLVLLKAVTLRGVLAGSKQQLEEVIRFVGSRGLEIPVDKSYGFNREEIIGALRYVESGGHIGKVCINLE